MLRYVLGHRPDEFGLVPDPEGFVPFKALLQALHEEDGWRHVRESNIREVMLEEGRSLFRCKEKSIRAEERRWVLDFGNPSAAAPKLLFTAVRRRAHPVVMEKGLQAPGGQPVVLSAGREMAERIGCRRDPRPIVLEIGAAAAEREGVSFHPFGDLYLCSQIPPKFILGPPVSEPEEEGRKPESVKADAGRLPPPGVPAGGFVLDIHRDPDLFRRKQGKQRRGWKEAARKLRKDKRS